MDDIVKQALAKWPNVPHCYGWLGLDARGVWRMRDARAQSLNLPGDKIAHAALNGFIARNYARDERGCWFFQNGPQRVYVRLEATPYVARSDPQHGFVLHTGAALGAPEAAFLCDGGQLILQCGEVVAQLDDRDLAPVLGALEAEGRGVTDDDLLAWLGGAAGQLTLRVAGAALTVQRLSYASRAERFGFDAEPVAG
jgi:hypothetical protein